MAVSGTYYSDMPYSVQNTIDRSLDEIQRTNNLVQGLEQLISKNKLSEVAERCKELEFNEAIRYLQRELTITLRWHDGIISREHLPDVLFYFLMRDWDLDDLLIILRRIWASPTATPYKKHFCPYRLSCEVLQFKEVFEKFYIRCGEDRNVLRLLLDKRPCLLFTGRSDLLIPRLIECFEFSQMHAILTRIKDSAGRSHMFYIQRYQPFIRLYADHGKELCILLSIESENGLTAVSENTEPIARLVVYVYLTSYRSSFTQLLQKSPSRMGSHQHRNVRSWLKDQLVTNNRYILYDKPRVVLVYNTAERLHAEEEALSIHQAFDSTNQYAITIVKNRKSRDIIELIQERARELNPVTNLPRSALIVILMSHGEEGMVKDCSGKPVRLRSIEDAMKGDNVRQSFRGRPKVLIVQSCRQFSSQTLNPQAPSADGVPPELKEAERPYVPETDHFCAVMSCAIGEESERNNFIPKLAEKIKNCPENKSFIELVEEVSQQMEEEGNPQKPTTTSLLRATLCLANANALAKFE